MWAPRKDVSAVGASAVGASAVGASAVGALAARTPAVRVDPATPLPVMMAHEPPWPHAPTADTSLRGAHTSPRAGGAESVTVQTARDFLEVEGVAFTRNKGYLLIEAAELERAAAEAATAARSQRVRQALLLYTSIVASGLAAMSIVPRLRVA